MKALNVVVVFIDSAGVRANNVSKRYASALFDNADSNYAEVFVQCGDVALRVSYPLMQIRTSIANALCLIAKYQWSPAYPSVDALLVACANSPDPLKTR
jgi:proteasome activator subunit 4